MEILLKSESLIRESPKEISIPDVDFEDDLLAEITLDALPPNYEFAKVTVNVKVQRLTDPETVRNGKKKLAVYVADCSSSAKVTLWEEHVGVLCKDVSYRHY